MVKARILIKKDVLAEVLLSVLIALVFLFTLWVRWFVVGGASIGDFRPSGDLFFFFILYALFENFFRLITIVGVSSVLTVIFSFFYKKKSTDPFSIRRLFLRILMVCVLSVGVLTLMFFLVFLGLMVLGYGFGPPS